MRFWLALALSILPLACAANLSSPGGETITVRGRVVDAESCASEGGCTPLAGMIVSSFADPERLVSEPTGLDGAFELSNVPLGYAQDLIVRAGEGATASVAPTINPMAVRREASAEDVFGLELYALPDDPDSVLQAIRREERIDLVLGGGYVGTAVRVEGTTITAASDAAVVAAPSAQSIRYVRVFPRFFEAPENSPVLRQPADPQLTGPFGTFVVQPEGPTDPAAILPVQDGWEFELVVAPLEPGFVTYAVHRGTAL